MASVIPQPPTPSTRPPAGGGNGGISQPESVMAVNTMRLAAVADRLSSFFKNGIRLQPNELAYLVFSLARAIDYAASHNEIPAIAHHLPPIIKEVFQHRTSTPLQSAIMVLMISAKNASNNGWFSEADANELLRMANELCSSFCMAVSVTTDVAIAQETISKIMPRFYPGLKLCQLIASFEAKPGYDVLMADFQIPRDIALKEKIRLFVVQTDNLETSSCIISPPQVSFLVNGKGVDRRTNVSLDSGPQFPTDITKMLKYGTNIVQAIGYFGGTYVIAVAFTSNITSSPAALKDYVQPAVPAVASDSEIIEGPSRISLNCPISFRRIKTPVKGHLCNHHQCFDYDNFMEMNSRKPSWRCPCCNQPISCIDLRIDQNMVKILGEVAEGVSDVVISADGSWRLYSEHNRSAPQKHNETFGNQVDMESESTLLSNMSSDPVDLTMEEDLATDAVMRSTQPETRDNSANQSKGYILQPEDRKPFKDSQGFPLAECFPQPPPANWTTSISHSAYPIRDNWTTTFPSSCALDEVSVPTNGLDNHMAGTLESLVPNVLLNSVITDAISPAPNREPSTLAISQSSLSLQHMLQTNQVAENMQLQPSRYGSSIISSGTERLLIPRHVTREPVAVQALPVQTQTPGSSIRRRANLFNCNSAVMPNCSSNSYESTSLVNGSEDGLIVENGDIGRQFARTSDRVSSSLRFHSLVQNQDNHEHQYNANQGVQQVVSLPAPSLVGMNPSVQQRGLGAYRAASQTPLDVQDRHSPLLNLRTHHSTSQISTALAQTPRVPMVHTPRQSGAGVTAGSSLGPHTKALLAQHAAQVARLQAGGIHLQTPRTTPTVPTPAEGYRTPGSEQLRNILRGSPAAVRPDTVPRVPAEQNWMPTGRMRGSLTGSAYSAALNHYLAQPTQQGASRGTIPVVASASEQFNMINSSTINGHGSVSQEANSRHVNASNQAGPSL